MSDDRPYTLPRNSHRGQENEYLELQEPGSEDLSPCATNGRARFENGPWTNQSKDAYSRSVENTNSRSLKEPLSRPMFYVFILGGILVFIVGLMLGILIGYFAIKLHSHSEMKRSNPVTGSLTMENDWYAGNKTDKNDTADGPYVTIIQSQTTTAKASKIPATTSKMVTTAPITSTIISTSTPHLPLDITNMSSENPTRSVCTCPTEATSPLPPTTASVMCNICERKNPYVDLSSSVNSPFAPLTDRETNKVINKLKIEGIIKKRAPLGSNYVNYIYLFPVEKAAALDFLDKNGPFPARYAEVHVTRGLANPPDIMIYKIGPVSESVSNMVVEKQVEDGEVHFNRRSYDAKEFNKMYGIFRQSLAVMRDVLIESFDGASFGKGISVTQSTLFSLDENDRRSGCYLYLNRLNGGGTLRVLPVSFIVHHPGLNTSNWYTSDFYYLNQGPFNSSEELAKAYRNGTLRKFRLPENYHRDYALEYALQRNESLPMREFSNIPPPRTYEPKGPRYKNKWNCGVLDGLAV